MRFELFSRIDDYLWLPSDKGVSRPDGYHAVLADAQAVRDALSRSDMPLVPCPCDLLCALRGLIQVANGNPADDFRAYAETRFARCRALMASPGFAAHLRVLTAI